MYPTADVSSTYNLISSEMSTEIHLQSYKSYKVLGVQ